ncbi:MAG: Hpt domain-containing protein [Opitutae bacterium]|nr:Hpt domain-containing protein [Opitutae bacterium]
MPDNPILDPHAIQALRDLSPEGGAEFLKELITIYLKDTPTQMTELEDALARQDAARVTRAAHTIKGSSGNFGAAALAQLTLVIEAHGKAGNLTAAAAALPGFKAEFARVREALQKLSAGA